MAAGLPRKRVPIFVDGGIDTKTNPKLVRGPALLDLENMYQLRTGEMRVRNGFTVLPATRNLTSADNLFPTQNGGLAAIARNWLGIAAYPQALRYGNNAGTTGWETRTGGVASPHPSITAQVSGVPVSYVGTADAIDPDLCLTAGFRSIVWCDGVAGTLAYGDHRDATSGKIGGSLGVPAVGSGTRPPIIASTGGNWMAIFVVDTSISPTTINVQTHASGVISGVPSTIGALDVAGATPWFDVKAIPGTSTFAVAYRATGGGIKCGIFNPATGTFTSVVATAGADASFCLGWLDDSLTTGNMYLATAGSASGVVVRTMSAATMVVSATNVIDATATAGVRNITGHLNTGAANYTVLWDVAGSSTIYDRVRRGTWTGAATVREIAPSHSLYSRSVKFPDGTYYVLGCFSSPVQPVYALLSLSTNATTVPPPQCYVLSGEAGGRRLQCSLSSPVALGSTVLIAASRSRKITTPAGTGTQAKTVAVLTFSPITSQIARAREMGGTVFLPGGQVFCDDGAAHDPATFPIYPEAATGVSSATGSMTAGGAYLYRLVFRANDAAGRVYRSAASVPLAITLGGGDGRVTLTMFSLRMPRGDYNTNSARGYGAVVTEIYRAGPGASGASLYNKVGEIQTTPLSTDTVTFIDTMSDLNAALGEAAYFNGNVYENFHPPACRLLEVNGNRVGLVNAEDPTEFWYSKEYKAGTGIGFNPLFKASVTGDGYGAITALAAMDGQWIMFKSGAVYVMAGDGPDDRGNGSFSAPRAVSRTIGTSIPGSLVETPDGIMFQSAKGIYLLDRGLGLSYIGAPVEAYTKAESVVDAALVTDSTQVRFVMPSGRCLVWDYHHKRWYTFQLRVDRSGVASTLVACCNSTLFGWCYALANGDVLQEVAGQTTDVNGTTTTITPRVSFPHLDFAGLAGYQRFYGLEVTVDVIGDHTISVDAEYSYSGSLTGTPRTKALTTAVPTEQIEYNPPEGKAKCTALRPVITISGPALNGSFRLTGVTAEIGVKRGGNVPATSRLT